jgi:hypothetical protein
MRQRVINGDRWIAERLAYLKGLLGGDVPDEQRQAIEAEIEVLKKERGIHLGGPDLTWFPRRWLTRSRSRDDRPSG